MVEEDEFCEEKLIVRVIAEIVSTRAQYWEQGLPFTLSKAEFQLQWESVDNWYTSANVKSLGEVGKRYYWNYRLNQERTSRKPTKSQKATSTRVDVSSPSKSTMTVKPWSASLSCQMTNIPSKF